MHITSKYYAKHGTSRMWVVIYRSSYYNREKLSVDLELFNKLVKDRKWDLENDMVEVPTEDFNNYFYESDGYFIYSKNEYLRLREEMEFRNRLLEGIRTLVANKNVPNGVKTEDSGILEGLINDEYELINLE